MIRIKSVEHFVSRISGQSVPSVPADDRRRYALHTELARDERDRTVVIGNIDDIGCRIFNLRKLRVEILITGRIRFARDDRSAAGFKRFDEIFFEPDGIIVLNVVQNGGALCTERIRCEFAADRSLKRIDKARAENIIARFGDRGGRRRRCDLNDSARLRERRYRLYAA